MKNDKNNLRLLMVEVAVLIVLVITLGVVLVWINLKNNDDDVQQGISLAAFLSDETEQSGRREVIGLPDSNTSAGNISDFVGNSRVEDGNFQVTMTTEWNYPDINTPAEDSYVENSLNNTLDTKFRVVLAEDESVQIYESPLLPVGSYTTGIPIKMDLAPGKYNCVVIYDLFVPGTDEGAGSVRVALTINIGAGI